MFDKKRRAQINIPLGILFIVLAGCGGSDEVGGAGQCGGADVSGVCVTVDSITPMDRTEPTPILDVFFNPDCDGDPSTDDSEPVLDAATAEITFSVFNLIPGAIPGATPGLPLFVTLTQYTVEFFEVSGNPQPTVSIQSRTFNESLRIDVGGTAASVFQLLPLSEKAAYRDAIIAVDPMTPGLPREYTARYLFRGADSFGNPVSVATVTAVSVGDFDFCEEG